MTHRNTLLYSRNSRFLFTTMEISVSPNTIREQAAHVAVLQVAQWFHITAVWNTIMLLGTLVVANRQPLPWDGSDARSDWERGEGGGAAGCGETLENTDDCWRLRRLTEQTPTGSHCSVVLSYSVTSTTTPWGGIAPGSLSLVGLLLLASRGFGSLVGIFHTPVTTNNSAFCWKSTYVASVFHKHGASQPMLADGVHLWARALLAAINTERWHLLHYCGCLPAAEKVVKGV
jgi:hypothetical protein